MWGHHVHNVRGHLRAPLSDEPKEWFKVLWICPVLPPETDLHVEGDR